MNEKEKENENFKRELYSLYAEMMKNNDLLNSISSEIIDISSYTNLSLIKDIKKSIAEIISYNKRYKENLSQLENTIKKLEIDIKYYLKFLLYYKIQNNSLEIKINSFVSMEEEYEELKEKVKYEEGKFLDNDRKDNEIIILRNENSKIKKDVIKFECQKKILESEILELKNKINILESDIENLKKKNFDLEKNMKENHNFNSTINIRLNNKENNAHLVNKKLKKNNFSYSNFQNIIDYTNNNCGSKNRKLISFLTPKEDLFYIDHSRNKFNENKTSINNILFTATYHKITKEIDKNKNKLMLPLKKDFNSIKYKRNNSLSVMKLRDFNESKAKSLNNNYLFKSDYKQKTFNKIINTKQMNQGNAFSLSVKKNTYK